MFDGGMALMPTSGAEKSFTHELNVGLGGVGAIDPVDQMVRSFQDVGFGEENNGTYAVTTGYWQAAASTSWQNSVGYVSDPVGAISTPFDAMAYMRDNFSFSSGYYDNWRSQPLNEFNASGLGDCKDFASFFGGVLTDDGWPVYSYVIEYGDGGDGPGGNTACHAFTVFQGNDSGWYLQSNNNAYAITSMDNAIEILYAYDLPQGSYVGPMEEFHQGFDGEWKPSWV